MKCTRVIEYEAATREELERHLAKALLTLVPEVRPGMNHPRADGAGAAGQPVGKSLMLFGGKDAPQVRISLVAEQWLELGAAEQLEAEAQVVGGSVMQRSVADLVRACEVLLEEEAGKAAPDNALIGLLCDVVRYTRETGAHATGQCNVARRTA